MRYLFLIFIIVIFLTSCGLYRQNVVNVTLMQQKGQTQVSGHIGFTGYDIQTAYAMTNHFGLIANYNDNGTKKEYFNEEKSNFRITKNNLKELGFGYFSKSKRGFISEYFFVFGNGQTSIKMVNEDLSAGQTATFNYTNSAKYNRFLFQADFGKSSNKTEFSFSPRIFALQLFDVRIFENNIIKEFNKTALWSDFALTLRYVPIKNLKISGQFSLIFPIAGKNIGFDTSPFNFSIGLILSFNSFKKNKK